jgi:predicted nucleic acid-binding protein
VAALGTSYLADKSALARFPHPAVQRRLRPLLENGLIATCTIIDLEVLYSARNLADYEQILDERQALPQVPITQQTLDRAVEVQHQLAMIGQHRAPIPDLLIAAAAEVSHTTLLHYDADFERIAEVTGQCHDWVVLRGSI